MIDIFDLLSKLSRKRPIFHSEADFQHELAWLIHECYPNAKIRLELPSGNIDKKEHLDLVVTLNNQIVVIELKYKKTAITIEVYNEIFSLKSDSALDISRYDYLKDIERIENYVDRNNGSIGYAIMISNEDIFWREMKPGQNSEAFFIHEGRLLPKGLELRWHTKASKGTMFGRTKSLTLKDEYIMNWKDYSILGDGRYKKFKVLVTEIK